MKRVLVVTTEPLPLPGGLTTGAGLRAWGLAEGLRGCGLDVTIATPLEGDQARQQQTLLEPSSNVRFFQRSELSNLVTDESPDVIVMQHWGLVYALPPKLECPLAIDLAGPHLLERQYWGNPDFESDLREKLTALSRADFVTVGGDYQRHYFYPFLAMAGFDITADKIPVIPFSVAPDSPRPQAPAGTEVTFIYGGAFLAWQNPEKPIRWLLEEMDTAGTGRLLFYGGSHPSLDASGGRFLSLYEHIKSHSRVEIRGWKPYEKLLAEYAAEGHVALDLMERNPERELAYTTRTMVYLACGLPVIYNDYSEISLLIERYRCGWCLDPQDEQAFRALIKRILSMPDELVAYRERALEVADRQTWDKTISPLAEFCESPGFRRSKKSMISIEIDRSSDPDSQDQPLPVKTPGNKSIPRNILRNPGKLLGIFVYTPVWLISKYLYHRLKVTNSSRAHNK